MYLSIKQDVELLTVVEEHTKTFFCRKDTPITTGSCVCHPTQERITKAV